MLICYFIITYYWTIGIYFAADNDLEPYAIQNIEEIKKIGSNQHIAIPIQIDYSNTHRPSTCERYFIKKDTLQFITNIGEVNTGAPNTLIEFAEWAFSSYRAKHNCLIIWDHGNGWKKLQGKGVGYDESSHDWLSVSEGELRYAMKKIKEKIGRNVDILCFDACTMAEIEVMAEISDYINFLVASQDIVPLNGFPYKEILSFLTTIPTVSPKELSDSIVTKYIQYYTEDTTNLASLDCSTGEKLFQILKELVVKLKKEPHNKLVAARKDLHDFCNLSYCDLYAFAKNIGAEELKLIIEKTSFCQSTRINANGISIWFPEYYSVFEQLVFDYINLQFSKLTEWEKFLFYFYNVEDTIPPTMPEIKEIRIGEDNSIEIFWSPSYDFTEVDNYELQQIDNLIIKLEDGGEAGFVNWESDGFNLSDYNPYNGNYSFFSKSGSIITNIVLTNGIIEFYHKQKGGLLKVFYSNDKQNWNMIKCFRSTNDWKRVECEIPSCEYVKLEFEGLSYDWVYIDDIKIFVYDSIIPIYVGKNLSYKIEKNHKGTYFYRVRAKDINNNYSMGSEIKSIEVKDFLTPYCYPNPVKKDCFIVYDIPKEENGNLYIYSLSGKLLYKIEISGHNDKIYWNAKDIPSGIYIGLIKTKTLIKKFKFAKIL